MDIKFLTLNIWHGGLLMDNLLAFLKDEQADVMCLQEVNDTSDTTLPLHFRSVETLKKHFPNHHFAYNPGMKVRYKEGVAEQGNLTLSRYPVREHSLIYFNSAYTELPNPLPGDNPNYAVYPKYLQKTFLNIENKRVCVGNLHGAWDFHGDDTPERLAMSRRILEALEGEEYVMLGGDSNAWWQTRTIGMINEKYPSVFKHILPSTFNMKHKKGTGYSSAAVDILHVSPNIHVVETSAPQVDVSDHLPLTATLRL